MSSGCASGRAARRSVPPSRRRASPRRRSSSGPPRPPAEPPRSSLHRSGLSRRPRLSGPTPPPTTPTATRPPAPSTPILGNIRPREPWYRRIHWPAPRYIALIVVGILVIGAGAAYGISQLTKSSSGSNTSAPLSPSGSGSSTSSSSHKTHSRRDAINPHSITVAVLNGTTVTGLAATVADKVEQEGFRRGNTNNALTQGQQAESVVEYSDGNVKAAELVGKKLGITQVEKIDPQTQGLAGDATVTVIVGADKAGGAGTTG